MGLDSRKLTLTANQCEYGHNINAYNTFESGLQLTTGQLYYMSFISYTIYSGDSYTIDSGPSPISMVILDTIKSVSISDRDRESFNYIYIRYAHCVFIH